METKHIFMTYENSISQCYNKLCHCFWPNLSRNLSPKQLENFTRREYETISIQLREIFLLHLDLCGRNAQLIYSSSRLFARVNWMMSHAIEKFSRCSRRRVDVDLKFFHEWNSRLIKRRKCQTSTSVRWITKAMNQRLNHVPRIKMKLGNRSIDDTN